MQTTGNGTGLRPRQMAAITAILSATDFASAADAAGVSRTTLYRWMAEPAFGLQLREQEAELLNAAMRRLLRLQQAALDVLEHILTPGSEASDAVRLRAACAVIDSLLQLRNAVDVEQRILALESVMLAGSR